jgi:hypothetical protein
VFRFTTAISTTWSNTRAKSEDNPSNSIRSNKFNKAEDITFFLKTVNTLVVVNGLDASYDSSASTESMWQI